MSARERPAIQPATVRWLYGDSTRSWTEPMVKS